MKKIILFFTILTISVTSTAQELSYGIILGTNSYDSETGSDLLLGDLNNFFGVNIGLYGDYQFGERLGSKLDIIYNSIKDGYSIPNSEIDVINKLNTLNFIPKLKYDFAGEYNNGFYVTAGTRIGIVLSAKEDSSGEDNKKLYNNTLFGGQLGFGYTFLEHYAVEILADTNINSHLKDFDNASTFGGVINLNINLESLLNK